MLLDFSGGIARDLVDDLKLLWDLLDHELLITQELLHLFEGDRVVPVFAFDDRAASLAGTDVWGVL